jgi:hypothetical protein
MPETPLVLAGGQSHVFEGTYGWDPAVIPLPPNDNPSDPYWQACTNGGTEALSSTYYGLDMYHSTGYGVEGPGWVLDEDGFVSTNHDFAQGATTVSVFASGWYVAGAWPHMRVFVDGAQIGQADVASEDLVEYSFTYSGSPGTKEIRIALDNAGPSEYETRALYVDTVEVETLVPPSYCGGVWGLTAWALLGDYRVPLGGTSFHAVAQPVGTLTTTTSVNSGTGDVTVTGTVTPPAGGQPVRIFVRYPSGRVDILVLTTDGGGHVTTTFPPKERGPLTVSSQLPEGGGPFGPTDRTDTTVDACIPTGATASCSDHIQNQGETGVDCGGPCPACVPSCTAATAVDLGAPGTNKPGLRDADRSDVHWHRQCDRSVLDELITRQSR